MAQETMKETELATIWRSMGAPAKHDLAATDPTRFAAAKAAYLKSRSWEELDGAEREKMYRENPDQANAQVRAMRARSA